MRVVTYFTKTSKKYWKHLGWFYPLIFFIVFGIIKGIDILTPYIGTAIAVILSSIAILASIYFIIFLASKTKYVQKKIGFYKNQ